MLVVLSVVASFSMFYEIGSVPPPYPWSDEASAGQDAVATLKEGISLNYPDQGGGGVLWVYLVALLFHATGPSLLAMRWLVGAVGVVSVLFAFGTLSELFRTFMPLERARWFALLASLWMATSFWHTTMSRVAWPPPMTAALVSAAFFFMWRGMRLRQPIYFIAMGIVIGVSMYTYLPGRFLMIVPIVYLTLAVASRLIKRQHVVAQDAVRMLGVTVAAAVLVTLPLLVAHLSSPYELVRRVTEVRAYEDEPIIAVVWRGLHLHADAFGFTLNLGRSPLEGLVLGDVGTLFFLAGLFTTVWRFRAPAARFMLLWWCVLLGPSVLAPSPPGSSDPTMLRRAIGALPVTFAFAVLGVEFLEAKVSRFYYADQIRRRAGIVIACLVVIVGIVWNANQTLQDFFVTWMNSPQVSLLFNPRGVDLVNWMNEHSCEDCAFVFPIRAISRSTTRPWIYVARFLYGGEASYIPDDEMRAASELVNGVRGKRTVYLLTERQVGADPKHVFPYLLLRMGQIESTEDVLGFEVQRFALNRWNLDSPSQIVLPKVLFGNALRLERAEIGTLSGRADRILWLELTWKNLGCHTDYKVTVRLQDHAGHLIAQQDNLLLNNLYSLPTSRWTPGAMETDYYAIQIPQVVLPDEYVIRIGVYDAATFEELPPQPAQAHVAVPWYLSEVHIGPLPQGAQSEDPPLATSTDLHLPEAEVSLLGVQEPLPISTIPGHRLVIPFLFRVGEPSQSEPPVEVKVDMISLDGHLRWPVGDALVVTVPESWPAGVPFRLFFDGHVPRRLSSGRYLLAVALHTEGAASDEAYLQEIDVTARAHKFDPPTADFQPIASVPFGNVARLLGYWLDTREATTEGTVTLTLYWQALQETDVAYKVFVHFLDHTGRIIFQMDQEPGGGEASTVSWLAGEVIADRLIVPVDARLLEARSIAVGMYDPLTGQRIMSGDQDHVSLDVHP
jgi:hypothetical protein